MRVLVGVVVGALVLGGCVREPTEVVATDGKSFFNDGPRESDVQAALKASGIHDLGCEGHPVDVRRVVRQYLVDGCGYRAVYEIARTPSPPGNRRSTFEVVLLSRTSLDPAVPLTPPTQGKS